MNEDFVKLKSKNLLIIANRYPPKSGGIGGIFVKEQVDILKNYFSEVMVISNTPYTPKLIAKFMNKNRVEDSLAENYKYDNVKVYYTKNIIIPVNYFRKEKGDLAYKKVKLILSDINFKPNIIHAHFAWPSGYAAVKIGKEMNVPVVITAHGEDVYDFPFRNNWWREKISKTLNGADYIITVSKRNLKCIDKLRVTTSAEVIPNGASLKLFHPMDKCSCRRKLNLPENKKIALSVGSLISVKGHKYLIDAAKIVRSKNKDVLFIIIGSGPLEKKLKKNINNSNLGGSVLLVGGKPHNEIPIWMNAADIFVLPSLNEGNPTVMFEALGVGLPFVGTAVGGVPEVIISDEYGFLCPPKNPECLAEKILIALEKDWDREKIREYAKQFSWDNIAKRIIEVYQEVLNK